MITAVSFFSLFFSLPPWLIVPDIIQVDGFYGQLGEKAAETVLTKSHHLEARERTVKSKASGIGTRVVALPVYNENSGGAVLHTIAADSKVILDLVRFLLPSLCAFEMARNMQ